jgi:hypothetical protein
MRTEMRSESRTALAENRRQFVGGSDARIIMGGDEAALLRLWREKRGEVEPEDLSGNLIVQLGLAAAGALTILRRVERPRLAENRITRFGIH